MKSSGRPVFRFLNFRMEEVMKDQFISARSNPELESIVNICLSHNRYLSTTTDLIKYSICFYAVTAGFVSVKDVPRDIRGRLSLIIDGLNLGSSSSVSDRTLEKILAKLNKLSKNSEVQLSVLNNMMYLTPEALIHNPPIDAYKSCKTSPHNIMKAAEKEYDTLSTYGQINAANKNGT